MKFFKFISDMKSELAIEMRCDCDEWEWDRMGMSANKGHNTMTEDDVSLQG